MKSNALPGKVRRIKTTATNAMTSVFVIIRGQLNMNDTKHNVTEPHLKLAPIFSALSISILLITILSSIHSNIMSLTSEDDIHFAYYAATIIQDADRHHQMTDKISHFLATEADAPSDLFRFDERNRVISNYQILSHVIAAVRLTMHDAFSETSYPQAVSGIINVSLHLNAVIILSILALSFIYIKKDLLLGTAIGLFLIIFINWFFPWSVPAWVLHVRPHTFFEIIERVFQTINLIFTAGTSAGGLESIFPRGNFIALTIPIFLLRWSGRHSASYALVAISCLVHLSMGALLMLSLLATDFFLRREVLRSLPVSVIISGVVGAAASDPLLTNSLGIHTSLPRFFVFFAFGFVSFFLLYGVTKINLPTPLNTLSARLQNSGAISSDLIALYALWCVIVPVSLIMYFSAGEARNPWTWGELPGRYLMIMNSPLIVGGSILGVQYARRYGARLQQKIALITLLVTIGLFFYALQKPTFFEISPKNLTAGIEAREQTVSKVEHGGTSEYVEADIYYAVARAMDLTRPFPSGLLTYTPGACRSRKGSCE